MYKNCVMFFLKHNKLYSQQYNHYSTCILNSTRKINVYYSQDTKLIQLKKLSLSVKIKTKMLQDNKLEHRRFEMTYCALLMKE